jgi:hypothetical protein
MKCKNPDDAGIDEPEVTGVVVEGFTAGLPLLLFW